MIAYLSLGFALKGEDRPGGAYNTDFSDLDWGWGEYALIAGGIIAFFAVGLLIRQVIGFVKAKRAGEEHPWRVAWEDTMRR